MADEHQALTVINLPFIDKRFQPGEIIPASDFEAMAEAAAQANPDGENMTAEETIAHLREWGSLGDPGDELHPDHQPVDPGKPTIPRLAELARMLVDDMTKRGEEIPADLHKMTKLDADYSHVGTVDGGEGEDK